MGEMIPSEIPMSMFRAALKAWGIIVMVAFVMYAAGNYRATNQAGIDALAVEVGLLSKAVEQNSRAMSDQSSQMRELSSAVTRNAQSTLDLREEISRGKR